MHGRITANEGILKGSMHGNVDLHARMIGLGRIQGRMTAEASLRGSIRSGDPVDPYTGAYEVDPSFERQNLETKDKQMLEDVAVNPIAVESSYNPSGGMTVYIGGVFDGE